ncbi:hypothetical protein FGU65_11595 [Methanoculleus sp. FWC-SCC1]|uniref:Uncharacterized protein n=1 Tax=Methanoculleus frigidifontis TaxID=2584085 RepID=A0ABT8MC64_9EURY|nr:hypothetical protein [Methanoculleus sp. FWC-SCC1]MDN7025524.1 hypothetical protein [Methanoculleus sp. FWC-SCC1]
MSLLYEGNALPEERGDDRKTMTLLQQIRFWMKMKEGGEQYHDEQDDEALKDYFDISPEVMVPSDEEEIDDLPAGSEELE